jgi:hypothetical protein
MKTKAWMLLSTLFVLSVLPVCAAERDDASLKMAASSELWNICVGINNPYACAQAIEQHQLKREIKGLKRKKNQLMIRLDNGTLLTLVNKGNPKYDDTSMANFSYIEYLPAIGYHLVHVMYYEGDSYVLINGKDGKKTDIQNIPIISPDNLRFVTASSDLEAEYNPTEIQIWRITAGGLFKEFSFKPSGWGPESPRWKNQNEVSITKVFLSNRPSEVVSIRQGQKGWQLEDKPNHRVVR